MNPSSLIDFLSSKYSHILGNSNTDFLSEEKIIYSITSYYEDIINSMPGNVYWLDKNCITAGCNKNVLDMFGLQNLSEFKGLDFDAMGKIGNWTTQATESFKRDTLDVIKTGKPKLNIEEPPIPHSDGRTIHFLTSRVPIFDRSGLVIGVVGISIDITELKQTQAALKKAKEEAEINSQQKSEFVANMSHDIKTPLAGIIGIAELLSYRLEGEELDFTNTLLMSSRQLLSFFDNCLEVFRLDYSDTNPISEYFDLHDLVYEIYDLYHPAILSKVLNFYIDYPNYASRMFIGNRATIYRILLNLVGNAVKFTNTGYVKIFVDVESTNIDKHTLILVVEDTGIGIPENKQDIIFERFTRLTPSYKGKYDGNGIGLYVVDKSIKNLSGRIAVASEEGKGSRFTVRLPIQLPESSKVVPIKSSPTTKRPRFYSNKSPKILLVEDNAIVQKIQCSLLNPLGCIIDAVDTGEKALEIFEPGKYDLILMDIGLPGIQGDISAKLIRKIELRSETHTPIVALTAHSTEETRKLFLAAGIDEIITKPLSYDQTIKIFERYGFGTIDHLSK